jgi:predicted  nucleic acid-binding Zn-ribbon protein
MARELEARFRQCLLLDDRLKDLNGQKDRIRGDLEAHVAACQRAQTSLAGRLDAVERLIEEQGGKLQSLHQAEEALSDRLTLIRNIAAASLLLGGAGLLLALIGP